MPASADQLQELLEQTRAGDHSPAVLLALAAALQATLGDLSGHRLAEIEERLGRSPFRLVEPLIDAANPTTRRIAAEQLAASTDGCACSGAKPPEPTYAQEEEAVELVVQRAIAPVLYLKQELIGR